MGSVVLSLDAELAWGFHDREAMPEDRVTTARESWLRLLELFDDYGVPATWAVVGHLLLDSCDGEHADHPAAEDGWFDRDPGTWEGRDEQWYGAKLIDAIEDADADHEVGSHTFSHVEMGHTTREIASAEMRTCVELAERRGLSVDSVVYPRNYVGHRDVLAAYGVKSYRGTQPRRWYDRGSSGRRRNCSGGPRGQSRPRWSRRRKTSTDWSTSRPRSICSASRAGRETPSSG
ncbi:polysaccharide deacetylase family protein [Halorussus caseinilyticus]|uniref:Polysaccharide deacetylase family protein n=1 Tax=Halorussus caseinilyticus TaxID=3034025 RepID=A0ABD5WHH7_9EURY